MEEEKEGEKMKVTGRRQIRGDDVSEEDHGIRDKKGKEGKNKEEEDEGRRKIGCR